MKSRASRGREKSSVAGSQPRLSTTCFKSSTAGALSGVFGAAASSADRTNGRSVGRASLWKEQAASSAASRREIRAGDGVLCLVSIPSAVSREGEALLDISGAVINTDGLWFQYTARIIRIRLETRENSSLKMDNAIVDA